MNAHENESHASEPDPRHATGAERDGGRRLDDVQIEPLSLSMLGKFFAVPFLIIAIIVGGAVSVVLLFGGPATAPHETVWALLQSLESNSGERSMGLLLTQEKELWQTALELSNRLDNKASELTPEELNEVAERVTKLLHADLAHLDEMPTEGEDREKQQELRSTRLVFLIRALGRTELPGVIPSLIDVVRSRQEPYATVGIHELANLREHITDRDVVGVISQIVSESDRTETLLTACPALSVLAEPGDTLAIEALTSVLLKHEGEVSWSAALALARLGSDAGKSSLMDLLDREFWSSGERYEVKDKSGTVHRYPMPDAMIERWLLATLDVVSKVDDADLWEMVDQLKSDPSLAVQAKANAVIAGRT